MDWQVFDEALKELEWPFTALEAADGNAPSLKVTVKSTSQPATWTLLLSASPTPIAFIPGEEEEDEEDKDIPRGYYALELSAPLAEHVVAEKEGELIQLLNFLNSNLPLAGFYWNSIDGKLFFRYLWFYHAALVEETIVLFLLQTIQALLDNYGILLQNMAAGKTTLDAVLAKWENDAKLLS